MNKTPKILVFTLASVFALCGCIDRKAPPAPVINLGANIDSPTGAVMISRNDTLYNISERYGLTIRDIIEMNGDLSPDSLEIGQRVKLPPPHEYVVRDRDSLYRLSRMFGTSVQELVEINDLKKPYRLKVGQKLQIVRDRSEVTYIPQPKVEVASLPAGKPAAVERAVLAPPDPVAKAEPAVVKTPSQTYTSKGFNWPVQGKILSSYGPKDKGLHNDGINIAGALGAPVGAADAGQVMYVGNALEGFGNLVLIKHDNGWVTAYAHLKNTNVVRGQAVDRGTKIGEIGQTGSVDTPQLHFEIRRGSEAINPQQYLPKV